jgi:predicted O-methyltransferase YrrM
LGGRLPTVCPPNASTSSVGRMPRSSRTAIAAGVERNRPIAISTGTVELSDDSDGATTVWVNSVPSSVLRHERDVLDFEYMRHAAAAILVWNAARNDPRWLALHIGAAACTLPRYLAHAHPESRHIAVDVDTALAALARRWWDLPPAPRLRVRAQDGLDALSSRGAKSVDLIVRDAFAEDATPAHLAGVQWWEQAARALRPGGLVVANVAVRPGDPTASADVAAASAACGPLVAVAEPAVMKGRRRGNVILVAGAVDRAELQRYAASAPLPTGVSTTWTG